MVVDLNHFETQSGAQTLRNCHEHVTKLCKGLRQHAFDLSKSVEISGQHTLIGHELRFWSSNSMISVTFCTLAYPQGYSGNALSVTKLCRGLRQHAFNLSKSVEISGQHTPIGHELRFWNSNSMKSVTFGRTTSLNSSEFEAPWQFCDRISLFCV